MSSYAADLDHAIAEHRQEIDNYLTLIRFNDDLLLGHINSNSSGISMGFTDPEFIELKRAIQALIVQGLLKMKASADRKASGPKPA